MWTKSRLLILFLLVLCLTLCIPAVWAAGPDIWEGNPTTVPTVGDSAADDSIRILGQATLGNIQTLRSVSSTAYYPFSSKVCAPNYPTVMVEMLVKKNSIVTVGDPVARVQGQTDPIELAQAQLNLRRAEDSRAEGLASREDALARLRLQLAEETDPFEREILSLTIQKQELALSQYRTQQEETVSKAQQRVTDLEKKGEVTTLYASSSGRVSSASAIMAGKNVSPGRELITISDESVVLYRVSSPGRTLFYGRNVSVSSNTTSGQQTGRVVGAPNLLPGVGTDGISYVSLSSQASLGGAPFSIDIEMAIVDYQNVLLVPHSAVFEDNTNSAYPYYYVMVYRDGVKQKCPVRVLYRTGREYRIDENTQYWVLWGIHEGDVLVAE